MTLTHIVVHEFSGQGFFVVATSHPSSRAMASDGQLYISLNGLVFTRRAGHKQSQLQLLPIIRFIGLYWSLFFMCTLCCNTICMSLHCASLQLPSSLWGDCLIRRSLAHPGCTVSLSSSNCLRVMFRVGIVICRTYSLKNYWWKRCVYTVSVKWVATSNADHGYRTTPPRSGNPNTKTTQFHDILPTSVSHG